jgi:Skp family chaperone for outer membrane proteins
MATATARVVVLMSPDEKERIATQAKLEGVSIGEFVRRSVASQMSDAELEAELQKRRPELEALLDELEASNARAHAALDAALDEAERTRRHFSRTRAERVAS